MRLSSGKAALRYLHSVAPERRRAAWLQHESQCPPRRPSAGGSCGVVASPARRTAAVLAVPTGSDAPPGPKPRPEANPKRAATKLEGVMTPPAEEPQPARSPAEEPLHRALGLTDDEFEAVGKILGRDPNHL